MRTFCGKARGVSPSTESIDGGNQEEVLSPPPPAPPPMPPMPRASVRGQARVPSLRVISVVWDGSVMKMDHGKLLPPHPEELTFGQAFNERVQKIHWPTH